NLLFHNGLLAPAFGALILGVSLGAPVLGDVCASRPLVVLGEASYALYSSKRPYAACGIGSASGWLPVSTWSRS
ncbi:MAG: acyltransferase, partial [Deltaproteobacteria bacterium]|nr:acyltransferase [Deltaproteobacteria bacterium]